MQHFFDIDSYNIFNNLLPEKEFSIVNAVKSSQLIYQQKTNTQSISENKVSISDQIRELAKLKDEGIITEQEFSNKKKQLLDKIN